MPPALKTSVNDDLRRLPLLDAAQKEELSRLEARFPKPRDLAQELVRRGWLTVFQGNQLLHGNAASLVLGQYILLDRIGEGGMGQVFKARQKNIDRLVALKVIRQECLDNPKAIARFQREIRAAGHLSHPNIVRAFDADQADGTYFIAMEYIDGVDLARMVKDHGPLAVDQACDFIRQAALGLQHAHERGLVHRDIKPANLLVGRVVDKTRAGSGRIQRPDPAKPRPSPWGAVKILDLGLARWKDPATGRASTHVTQMGSVMGTPDFLAPEQARNSHTCDIRADLYALGCTLYFLLAGRTPFVASSVTEKLIQHQVDEPEPVGEVRHAMLVNFHLRRGAAKLPRRVLNVPDHVAAIVKKLMAKRPEDRYQSPDELAQALDASLERIARGLDAKPGDATECEIVTPVGAKSAVIIDDTPLVQAEPIVVAVPVAASANIIKRPMLPFRKRRWLQYTSVGGAVLLGLILAVVNGNHSKPQAGDEVEKKVATDDGWKALQQEVQHKKTDPDELRTKLLEFRRQNPAREREVAALLREVASPFDVFDRTKIEAKQWYGWMPDELVAVMGMWRGFQVNRLNNSVAVSSDGKWIIGGDGTKTVRVWETAAGNAAPWGIVNPTWGRTAHVSISPNARSLATANEDGAARLYDLKSQKLLHTLEKHTRGVSCVAFHPRNPLLATAGNDGMVRLWNTVTGAMQTEIQTNTGKVTALSFTPDGKHLFWGGDNQEVNWADLTGHSPNEWRHAANAGTVKLLAFHPDNRTLVCGGGDGTLRLCTWDGRQIKPKASLDRHARPVHAAAFAADGQTFVSAGEDCQLIVWDAATGAMKKTWELRFAIHGVAFAQDSRHVVVANANGTLYVFRLGQTPAVAQAR